MRRAVVFCLLALGFSLSASATEQQAAQSAVDASRLAVAAWECHIIGEGAGYDGDLDRLFQLGLRNGMRYLDDLEAGKVSQEQIYEHVPLYWQLVSGHSNDFILGRLYQAIYEEVRSDLIRAKAESVGRELRLTTEFQQKNCELLRD
jgi:hypothetical protein